MIVLYIPIEYERRYWENVSAALAVISVILKSVNNKAMLISGHYGVV